MAVARIYDEEGNVIATTTYRSATDGVRYLFDEQGNAIEYDEVGRIVNVEENKDSIIVAYERKKDV